MENPSHPKHAFASRLVQRLLRSRRISLPLLALVLSVTWTEAQSASDNTLGTPVTGNPGRHETTAQIMAREAALASQPVAPNHAPRPVKSRHVHLKDNPPQNPDSPLTSSWPLAGGTAPSGSSGPLAPQTVGTSFLGAQLSDTIGYVPPDSMADVGTNQIVVCVNGRIRTFNRNGVADGALDTTTDNFFASVLGGSSTSDPRVRFDRLSGHWFITMITVNTPNFVLIAVSSGPTITSASSFTFFSFKADPSNFGDYDTLGVDANALYIGLNIFNGNNFVNTTGFVVNKANLFSGTLTVTTFANLIVSSGGHRPQTHGPFTPQGVNNDDPAATQGYFIGVDATSFGTLVVRRVSNPGGTPSISTNFLITVPITGNPLGGVPTLGSSQGLDDLDDRLFCTRMHKGSLWTAHNIEVDATGVASGTGGREGSRWYQITNLTATPKLAQSGTLFDPAASNPRNFWIPSCAMSGQGQMALGCSVAGNNEFADIATAGRFATDPAGTLQSPVTAATSSTTYNIGSQNNRYRWGDFSVTTVDPSDDMTFWTVQEYCNANNSWGVQVIKLLAPLPATPMTASPLIVTQGVTNVSVTITGSATNGAGFFDPGTGFPNHISAAVNGGGVTVNSVTYNNPSNITANLTIAGTATPGARTVTVTNPDGQSATSSTGILTVAGLIGPTNQPPTLAAISNRTVNAGTMLTVTNSASDLDGDSLTFSLGPGAAINSAINPTNGIFTWTPMQSQAGTNHFSVIVTDNGSPPLSATQTFAVTVIATNVPPTLSPIADRTIHALMTVTITNSATDPDVGQTLTYSLDPGAPTGASIAATSGIFTWTPDESQIGTNHFTVRVTDNGVPPLSATQSFAVIVEPRPVLTIGVTNGIVTLTWSAIAGLSYQPQFETNLTDNAWTAFPSNVLSAGPIAEATDTNSANTNLFYRIFVLP